MSDEHRDAVAGIVDDLCHVLGVRAGDVERIEITPGLVEVFMDDEEAIHGYRYQRFDPNA